MIIAAYIIEDIREDERESVKSHPLKDYSLSENGNLVLCVWIYERASWVLSEFC